MNVVPLTLTISLCLVFTFVVFFLREHARGIVSSPERDSLLPLAEEDARPARAAHEEDEHSHSNEANCGCHNGSRQPCPGCLKRR